jgi:hypothetical protein
MEPTMKIGILMVVLVLLWYWSKPTISIPQREATAPLPKRDFEGMGTKPSQLQRVDGKIVSGTGELMDEDEYWETRRETQRSGMIINDNEGSKSRNAAARTKGSNRAYHRDPTETSNWGALRNTKVGYKVSKGDDRRISDRTPSTSTTRCRPRPRASSRSRDRRRCGWTRLLQRHRQKRG